MARSRGVTLDAVASPGQAAGKISFPMTRAIEDQVRAETAAIREADLRRGRQIQELIDAATDVFPPNVEVDPTDRGAALVAWATDDPAAFDPVEVTVKTTAGKILRLVRALKALA